jgi:hypothetical protein
MTFSFDVYLIAAGIVSALPIIVMATIRYTR